MRKPASFICENKSADQLCSYHAADQGLRFCYINTGGPRYSTNVRVQRLHRAAYPNRAISRVSNLTLVGVWLVAKTHYNH